VSFPRASGILLHPTSLPSPFGIGDLGEDAFRFADFLESCGQTIWQTLPLGPTGYGDSPYASYSAFAGNTMLISPQQLIEQGLLDEEAALGAPKFSEEHVEFQKVIEFKQPLLRKAFDRFQNDSDTTLHREFQAFTNHMMWWLDDYALFRALKDAHEGRAWNEWEPELVRRDPQALERAREHLREEIEAQKFYQYLFFKQWAQLRSHCHMMGIKLVGDIPIFVAQDSADVWTQPRQFKLDEQGKPIVVAGVPPDYFSKTGQMWGNPIYNWEQMLADGFSWWIKRVQATLQIVDILRIDHFRGFAASWEIPGGDKTAERGAWVNVPGRELFRAIKNALGELPIMAEDLGVITPDVEKLRDEFGFPGMRILQFGFSSDTKNNDLPHNYIQNSVAYTGTHDNDTTLGWFNSHAGAGSTRDAAQIERERRYCLSYLNSDGSEIQWDFIRALLASVANTAIIPLQDVLGLGTEARMNLPNSVSGNWAWRYKREALTNELGKRLRKLTEVYGRMPETASK